MEDMEDSADTAAVTGENAPPTLWLILKHTEDTAGEDSVVEDSGDTGVVGDSEAASVVVALVGIKVVASEEEEVVMVVVGGRESRG